jgi:hypothetical protein
VPNTSAKRDCLLPVKVNEDLCFSSPKPARGVNSSDIDLGGEAGLFMSPSAKICPAGKENWQPPQGLLARQALAAPRTPAKTPSRLPTVQEDAGQGLMPLVDEQEEVADRETMPAWVVQSPEPARNDDTNEDGASAFPKPSVKSTFIQFVSPLKTFSVMSPPKTEPVNFAPSASAVASLFEDSRGDQPYGSQATSDSPSPWFTHDQIPFWPANSAAVPNSSALAPAAPPAAPITPSESEKAPAAGTRWADVQLGSPDQPKQKEKGPVVRLAEFFPDPPAPSNQLRPVTDPMAFLGLDQATSCENYGFNMPPMPVPPIMPVAEAAAAFAAGFQGMTSPGFSMDAMQGQDQWQQPQLLQMQHAFSHMQPVEQVQPQDLQMQPQANQSPLEQIQAQMQQMQVQQMQMQQMQPPVLQAPQMQPHMAQVQSPQMPPPHMQPPLAQASQMQAPQMMPAWAQPQAHQMPHQMPDNMFLQQLMQLQMQPQMQPPSWPPLQAASMASEHVPAPPPQAAMEPAAPSVLCPSTCHQSQVCRCGEVQACDNSAPTQAGHSTGDEQQTAPNPCILTLSAAMFPEMGSQS